MNAEIKFGSTKNKRQKKIKPKLKRNESVAQEEDMNELLEIEIGLSSEQKKNREQKCWSDATKLVEGCCRISMMTAWPW